MLLREPLVYLQHYSPFIVSTVLDQTYLHLLFMCSTAHASFIQIAGLEMNYLQLMRNYDLHSMPYWPNDSPFESQLVVASPPGISFFAPPD